MQTPMNERNQLKALAGPMLAAVNEEMKVVLAADIFPPKSHLYGMMQVHMGWLDESFSPCESNPGKQIRPLLVLLVCQAAGGDWRQAVPAAAAVELLHNFSLIHDDIEDRSPTRRGRRTLWEIWGVPLAINAGDAMFALAHIALQRLSRRGVAADIVLRAAERFDETCLQLTEGQHADMQFEGRASVPVDEYLAMITGKTSVLLSLCADLGSRIAGRDSSVVNDYAQFGLNLGLAFQVQDDILGIWGDEAAIGKSATSDLETRKKTLPVLFGLEKSEALRRLFAGEPAGQEFIREAIAALEACGAREQAAETAAAYTALALAAFESAAPAGPAAAALLELTNFLLARHH